MEIVECVAMGASLLVLVCIIVVLRSLRETRKIQKEITELRRKTNRDLDEIINRVHRKGGA